MISDRVRQLRRGALASPSKLDAIDRAATRGAHLSISQGMTGNGQTLISQTPYGTFINQTPAYENPVPLGPHILVSTGPTGDTDDMEGPVYWARQVYCSTNDDDAKVAASWTQDTATGSDIYPVTCLEEIDGSGEWHTMPLDGREPVLVYGVYDNTVIDGTMDSRLRRFFTRGRKNLPFLGIVVDEGPAAEADFTDENYWVEESAAIGIPPVLTRYIQAVNLYEILEETHLVPIGTTVEVHEGRDSGHPGLPKYFFTYSPPKTPEWVECTGKAITDGSCPTNQGVLHFGSDGIRDGETRVYWRIDGSGWILGSQVKGIQVGAGPFDSSVLGCGMIWPSSHTYPPDVNGNAAPYGWVTLNLVDVDFDLDTLTWANQPTAANWHPISSRGSLRAPWQTAALNTAAGTCWFWVGEAGSLYWEASGHICWVSIGSIAEELTGSYFGVVATFHAGPGRSYDGSTTDHVDWGITNPGYSMRPDEGYVIWEGIRDITSPLPDPPGLGIYKF